jgi:hypothetical protein
MRRKLDESLQQDGVCQVPWLQTLVMEQARQPLRRSFLFAKVTSQLGLTAGLPGNNPTATFIFDMRAATQYASPAYPL